MQTSAMKACFQIAECSLSYAKIKRIIQISKKLLKKLILQSPFSCLFPISSSAGHR